VKRRVHRLDDAQIGLAGDGILELESWGTPLEWPTLPIVLHDDDRVAAQAPRGDQLCDVRLGLGIVARPERRILEAALNIDHQQRTLPDHASDSTRTRTRRVGLSPTDGGAK